MKGPPGGWGVKPGAMVTARHDVTHPHRVVITAETANHPRHAKKQTAHITANCEKKKKGEVVVGDGDPKALRGDLTREESQEAERRARRAKNNPGTTSPPPAAGTAQLRSTGGGSGASEAVWQDGEAARTAPDVCIHPTMVN